MKNIFDFATKELSQDAFLRWLLESYNCKEDYNLCMASIKFIKTICEFRKDEKIEKLTTFAQWYRIDVSAIIETNERKIGLFIEDKVFSHEHNQLKKYNESIEKIKKHKKLDECYRLYYKTHLLSKKDEETIRKANWKKWDINNIYKYFYDFDNTDCLILRQYIEFIKKRYTLTNLLKRPMDDNVLAWQTYFEKVLSPNFNEKYYTEVEICRYSYTYFALYLKRGKERKVPYLEIRSRDCVENKIQVRFLCYGIDYDKHETEISKIIEKLKEKSYILQCKNLRGEHPKQLAKTQKNEVRSDEEFVSILKECISIYENMMDYWENN